MLTRRAAIGALMGGPLIVSPLRKALAQGRYPDRPVRLIVPFPPGGPADISGRLVAQALGERLKGSSFVVENRSGASGTIGMGALAQAKPDGYTLAIGAGGALTMMPHLMPNLPFDVHRDFQPISVVMVVPQVLTVRKTLPVKNVNELLKLAREQPGKINYGSSGIGASLHLATELFKLRAGGVSIVHVPYRGAAPALNDLMGGQIDMLFGDVPVLLPQIQGGTITALAIAAKERLAVLPDVPTLRESGIMDAEAESFYGLLGPAGLPKELTATLHKTLAEALVDSTMRRLITDQGGVVVGNTPEQFSAYIVDEAKKWGEVIRLADVKMQ